MHLSADQMIFWRRGFLKLNGTIVFTWALMLVLVVGSKLVTRNLSTDSKRSRWQNLLEMIVTSIETQIEEVGLPHPEKYLGFLGTLLLFLATANLFTVIPGYQPPTGSLSTTAALALCVFVAVPFFGIKEQGLGGYLKSYTEPTFIMLPFNIISEVSRTLALAVRLFGNMMSGVMIIAILLTITPFVFPIVMTTLGPAHRHGAGLHLQHPGRRLHRRRDARSQAQARAQPLNTTRITKRKHHGQYDDHRGGIHLRRRHHHRPRQPGACVGGREGRRHGAELAGPAAGCVQDDHADPVRGPGDDRVAGDLLLRGLDDPHFRQPVLESRHREDRR